MPGSTSAAAQYENCSLATRSVTSRPSPTGRAPTARWSASTKRWRASGPTGSSTAHTANALPHCHTGSTTTTGHGHTAHSEDDPRSAAFTTYLGRTARGSLPRGAGEVALGERPRLLADPRSDPAAGKVVRRDV